MEAAEDPDAAQLWWPPSRQRRHDTDTTPLEAVQLQASLRPAIPCLVGQGYGDPSNKAAALGDTKASMIFDVFAPDGTGAEDAVGLLPPTVQVHNIAADDAAQVVTKLEQESSPLATVKQYQDDLSTPGLVRTQWFDVVDDDDDLTAYHFFDAIAEEATADAKSQEHRTQCGPYQVVNKCGDFVYEQPEPRGPLPLVSDSSASAGHILHQRASGCRQPEEEGISPEDFGGLDAGVQHAPRLHSRLKDIPGPGGFTTQFGPLPSVGFMDHARSVLPDVFPDSCEEDEFDEVDDGTQCGALPLTLQPGAGSYHAWSGKGMATPTDSQRQCSADGEPVLPVVSLDHDIGTQCGQLPQPSCGTFGCSLTPQTQLPGEDFDSPDHDLGTQCGPLPQPSCGTLGWTLTPQTQMQSKDFGFLDHDLGTQCGPLPLADDHGFDGFTIFDLDLDSPGLPVSRTPCGHLPQQPTIRTSTSPDVDGHLRTQCGADSSQTSRTQCGPLPIQYLDGLQTSLQQLVAVSLEPNRAPLDVRTAALKAYAVATSQFALELGLDQSDGTQCGPLPQQQNPRGSDRLHVQLGPSYLQVAKDISSKTPRTQCGPLPSSVTPRTQSEPLPQTQTSLPLGKHNGKGKRKGKDKKAKEKSKDKSHKPLTPDCCAQSSFVREEEHACKR